MEEDDGHADVHERHADEFKQSRVKTELRRRVSLQLWAFRAILSDKPMWFFPLGDLIIL
jgi:hypothetical protein